MAGFTWLTIIRNAFAAPVEPAGLLPHDIRRFGIGVCPGCRRLRGVGSLQCGDCGSAAPVTEDA